MTVTAADLSQLAMAARSTAAELSKAAAAARSVQAAAAALLNGRNTVTQPPPQRRYRSGMDGFDERAAEAFPLAVGHFRGLRVWDLRDDGRLVGANGYIWTGGEQVAECRQGHQVPCDGTTCPDPYGELQRPRGSSAFGCSCGCGFWAYWDLSDGNVQQQGRKERPVIGVVEGYGRALEGERGFRAEKARIVGLHVAFEIRAVSWRKTRSSPVSSFNPHSVDDWITGMSGGYVEGIPAHPEDELRALELNLEIRTKLEDAYQCPVYETTPMLLMKHPLGSGG